MRVVRSIRDSLDKDKGEETAFCMGKIKGFCTVDSG